MLTAEVLADVGGSLEFTAVVGHNRLPALPRRLLQIRPRTGLRGNLRQPTYLVRSSEIILARHVRVASELRELVGLGDDAEIGVLFFANDDHLESVWARRAEIVVSLRTAGYSFVTSPSFSLYEPRSRLDHLYNLRRSDLMLGMLSDGGVPVIPRIDWVIRHDIERAAQWLERNALVSAVALDWMTLRSRSSWALAVDGLRMLDDRTGRRLHFLINGPSNHGRRRELGALLGTRVTTTKSTLASPPPAGAVKTAADPYCWRAREEAELGIGEAA